jgi:hypothetical protein
LTKATSLDATRLPWPQPAPEIDPRMEGALQEYAQWTWVPTRLTDEADLLGLLSTLVTQEEVGRLSHLLFEYGHWVTGARQSRRDTLVLLARLVRSRQLTLWQRRVSDLVLAIQRRKRVVAQDRQARTAALTTPSKLRGRQDEALPMASAAPAESMVAGIDQSAQAATLKLAAQHGVPFCEQCAR